MSMDDDYDYDHHHSTPRHSGDRTDLSSAVRDNVHTDTESGVLQIFGKKFDVGPTVATILDPLVIWGTTILYQKGGTKAREWTMAAAKGLKASEGAAAKWGMAGELLVRVGGPVLQFSTDIKKTVKDAYNGMHDLKEEASVLLSANDSNVLTSNFSAVAHKRAQVYEQGKRNVIGSVLSAVRQAPAFLAGYNQYHLDRIENPKLAVASMSAGASAADKAAVKAKYFKMQTRYTDRVQREALRKNPDLKMGGGSSRSHGTVIPDELQENPLVRSVSWLFNPEARKSMRSPASEADFRRNIANTQLLPPALAFGVDAVRNKYVGKHHDNVVAWDLIKELEDQIKHDKHPDVDRVAVKVKDIFTQHAKDLGKRYEPEGKSFENAVAAITNAIVYKKMPVQALAEALDNKKIVSFGARDANFGDIEDINVELKNLRVKYAGRINEGEFYKNSAFTKTDLVNTFNAIPEGEKPFFALLFPPGILEKAGADKEEVRKVRQKGKQYFVSELTDMTRHMMNVGHDELKKQGVKSKYLDELEAFQQNFYRADRTGSGAEFIEQNVEDASHTMRNVLASTRQPGELWKEFVARKNEAGRLDIQPKNPLDHATRESGDSLHLS